VHRYNYILNRHIFITLKSQNTPTLGQTTFFTLKLVITHRIQRPLTIMKLASRLYKHTYCTRPKNSGHIIAPSSLISAHIKARFHDLVQRSNKRGALYKNRVSRMRSHRDHQSLVINDIGTRATLMSFYKTRKEEHDVKISCCKET